MNGAAHYAAAERLLAGTTAGSDQGYDQVIHVGPSEMDLKAAHVHAMLAVAAATVEGETSGPVIDHRGDILPTIDNFEAWQQATS